jgi:OPT oligopeptide transporter protein
MGLLDGSKQCPGQPALWGQAWFGHGYSHLRLGSNRLHHLPFSHPLVGCCQYWHRRRIFLLVPRSHSLCETTLVCSFRVSCLSEYRFLQYTNVWYSAYLPLVSSDTFDNTGKQYNVSQIINSDSSFNLQAYNAYSPIFLSASLAITYGLDFATITATLTHTFLYYRKYIWTHARRPLSEQPDIHAHLMSVYKEVPDWWYLTISGLRHLFFIIEKRMLIHSQ